MVGGEGAEELTIDFSDDGLIVNGGLVAMLPQQVGGQFGFSIFRAIFGGGGGRRRPSVRINRPSPSAGTTPSNPVEMLAKLPLGPMPKGQVAANPGEAGGMVGVLDGTADVTSAWSELRTLTNALEIQGLVPARRVSAEELIRIDSSLDTNSAAALIGAVEASRGARIPQESANHRDSEPGNRHPGANRRNQPPRRLQRGRQADRRPPGRLTSSP